MKANNEPVHKLRVTSVNISNPQELIINGRKKITGIFKKPVTEIYLEKNDVKNDHVHDRKHHGGKEKACYIFSTDQYRFWKDIYPDLDWNWGMFGENITIENWDENDIRIGDVFKIGEATVQCSQPRIPCNTLSSRFGDKHMLKTYANHDSPGSYVRIIEEGVVQAGDVVELLSRNENSLTMVELHKQIFPKSRSKDMVKKALEEEQLSDEFKKSLKKRTLFF